LEELGRQADSFDAVDRAEITCGRLIADGSGNASGYLGTMLTHQLARLPAAVETQLIKLGVLEREAIRIDEGSENCTV
jgi:hypothetical protein